MLQYHLLHLYLLLHHVTVLIATYTTTQCSTHHMMGAVQTSAHCKPRDKVVKLELPGNGSFTQMTPQYVEVKLCGGECHSSSHSCISTHRVSRRIPVLLSRCGVSLGVCTKSCGTVTVEEDTQCSCDCLEEQKMCATIRHSFNSHTCGCECKNREAYTLCRDQGRVWDTEECVCRCPQKMVKPCSTGFTFDHSSTCYCIPKEASNNSTNDIDIRVERSDSLVTTSAGDDKYVEIIIIAALGGISVVFFIIIISLLSSIKNLRSIIINISKGVTELHNGDLCIEHSLLEKQND